jgi:lysyl-tRNA synthetase class 2
MMELCEGLVASCAQSLLGSAKITCNGEQIDLAPPWPRITYADALRKHAGIDMHDEAAVLAAARTHQVPTEGLSHWPRVDKVFAATVDHHLIQPTFILHQPSALCPLSKVLREAPELAVRFEAYVGGIELANAYSELNDPLEQAERLRQQSEAAGGAPIDTDFVAALEHGLPPTGGIGIGIDRLAMILLDKQQIRDVILFPLLRPES